MKENIILIDENIPLLSQMLDNCGKVNTFTGRLLSNNDLINSGCDVLITRSQTKVNEELLSGTMVKFVATATAGIDHIDVKYLKNNRIVFANAPGANANSVAEYVVYAILKWADIIKIDIAGKSLGIIGYGNIGKLVAKYGKLLGMKIFVNDPPLKEMSFRFPDYVEYSELDEICEISNVITNHVPLEFSGKFPTNHLLDGRLIKNIKSNALFIHSSRGGVVDEKSLLCRLEKDEIMLCIDVWENEPDFNTVLAEKAILCSPHIAGYSRDGKLKGTLMVAEAYEKFSSMQPDYAILNEELLYNNKINNDDFNNHSFIRNVIEKSRKFEYDTSLFRNLINLSKDERTKEFDSQRKNYPVRREVLS